MKRNILLVLFFVIEIFLLRIKLIIPAVLLLITLPVILSGGCSKGKCGSGKRNDAINPDEMTIDEAREVLDIKGELTEDIIKEAHRKFMKKTHPDQGGNDYLAAKINNAKEILLAYMEEQG